MATVAQSDIVQVNSTSYVDLLGVLLGLRRFTGETSDQFRERLGRAVSIDRGPQYRGVLNEISLQLGLVPREAIRIWNVDGDLEVSVDISGLHLSLPAQHTYYTFPLLSVDGDDLWVWKKLSELVAEINRTETCWADLVDEDGPALQLVKQSNVLLARGEPVAGASVKLEHSAFVPGSAMFNTTVPAYTVQGQVIAFQGPVPEGTTVTYQYRTYPCTLVASPVGLLNLLDVNLASVAVTENNKLVYQMREYLQSVTAQDRSYWGV